MKPFDFECHVCGALAGKPCMTPKGKLAKQEHATRGYTSRSAYEHAKQSAVQP